MQDYLAPLMGGILIGISASLLLLLLGRISGISGIFFSSVQSKFKFDWRMSFLLGLPIGTFLYHQLFSVEWPSFQGHWVAALVGGLLVGAGVKLGSGCTSGHGVCGIARFSPRSIVATCVFIFSGIFVVWLLRLV